MFICLDVPGSNPLDAPRGHQDDQFHHHDGEFDMRKILIMAALALLTAGSFMSAAIAAPAANFSPLPPRDIPPPPPGCQNAILVISPDPEVGVYWKCLDYPGH
jgi:hypothetical protein